MKLRVYIADDHALLRRGLAALIGEQADMEVNGEAGDYETAIQEIQRLRPDVVIVDLSMHGSSGIQLIKNIKEFDPGIRIVVLSVHDERVHATPALEAGAKGYVMKGGMASNIIDAIRKVAKGKLYVSDRISKQIAKRPGEGSDQLDARSRALNSRELDVAAGIGSGLSMREIAVKLHLSLEAVQGIRERIKEKAGLESGVELVRYCVECAKQRKSLP